MTKRCIYLALLNFYGLFLYAQQQPIYIHSVKYGAESGLPQSYVTGIQQDKDGFIWVSTMDGLARFDGYEFLTFRSESENPNSISTSRISQMFIDKNNKLWLKHDIVDLDKFDPVSFENNRNLQPLVTASLFSSSTSPRGLIIRDINGNWLLKMKNSALLVYQYDDPLFKEVLTDESTIRKDSIHDFQYDKPGVLWVITKDSLIYYSSLRKESGKYELPAEVKYVGEFVCLADDNNGNLVIGGLTRLFLFNKESREWSFILLPQLPNVDQLPAHAPVYDHENRLVFAFQRHVLRLEHNGTISVLWKHQEPFDISHILIDKSNAMWVGTNGSGLYKINLNTPSFHSRLYKKNFFIDLFNEEFEIDHKSLSAFKESDMTYNVRYNYVSDSELLFYINKSLYKTIYRLSKGSFDQWAVFDSNIEAYHSGPGQEGVLITDRFNFYLLKGDKITKSATIPPPDKGRWFVQDIQTDEKGIWLISETRGLFRFEKDFKYKHIRLKSDSELNVIRNDLNNHDILWVGSLGAGLFKYDKVKDSVLSTYTIENGLPNNTINTISQDDAGYLWISTNAGISRFDPVKERFSNYSTSDGLIESEFNRHHELRLPDGRIAMGGLKGYSVFNPTEFTDDTFEPEVKIVGVSVNGKNLQYPIDSAKLQVPLNSLSTLALSYNENTIGLFVSSDQYNMPEKIKFRFMLEGLDNSWIENGSERDIRFNKLPYGNYTLLINASNPDGYWSPRVRRLDLIIQPPLWFTWWAYLIYVTVVGLVARAYWRGYKKRLIARQETEFNIRETARLRELDQTKTRFFSNITHEFRTPLTLILSPLEKYLKDDSLPPKALTLLNNNYRHANQLLKLVNQLLDIAKLESGQMRVNTKAGEFDFFAIQCVDSFQPLAHEKKISLSIANANVAGNYLFDHEKWEKILFNLLSNAIKFTPSHGKVDVSISYLQKKPSQPNVMRIQIQDSGVGLDDEEMPKIFDRFYQVDDSVTRAHEGTGIGLSLVKELVNLMGGTVHVSSVKNQGTLFTIETPIEQLKEIPSAREVTSINNLQIASAEAMPGIDHDVPVILVVEDNEELRTFIRESLAGNWHVFEASNGLDGWSIIERELPEIVISDVMMPGMNGFDLCSKSKRDPRTCHIDFIMLTAKTAQEAIIKGLESGADEYLTKPFHLYELELRIKNLLQEQLNMRAHLQDKLLPKKPVIEFPLVNDIFLARLQTYLTSNIDNTKLKVDAVASAMAMSKSTLNRKLKALLNISINDYVKQYRLQKAVIMLSEGQSISEVAYRVGFESTSYFAQCFKEHFKQTPTEFNRARD